MPSKSKQKFKYTLAAYPINWKKYVISPQKICIQFDDLQIKARAPFNESNDLKRTPWGTKEIPIDTHGTDIETLAVGIPLHLYPTLIQQIYTAIKEHSEKHPEYSILKEIEDIFNGK